MNFRKDNEGAANNLEADEKECKKPAVINGWLVFIGTIHNESSV